MPPHASVTRHLSPADRNHVGIEHRTDIAEREHRECKSRGDFLERRGEPLAERQRKQQEADGKHQGSHGGGPQNSPCHGNGHRHEADLLEVRRCLPESASDHSKRQEAEKRERAAKAGRGFSRRDASAAGPRQVRGRQPRRSTRAQTGPATKCAASTRPSANGRQRSAPDNSPGRCPGASTIPWSATPI